MKSIDKVEFTFGWLALKLLGKSLYSNAWSAISELVANGFDARAKNVYVYINAIDKSHAIVEIMDDGEGMSREDMKTYAQVGYEKRVELQKQNLEVPQDLMGRKGIGKLAALYLTENYFISTKKDINGNLHESTWKMHYFENENINEHPALKEVDNLEDLKIIETWNKARTGTVIQMLDVNLLGLGNRAFEALQRKLANHFSLDSMKDKHIYLYIQEKKGEQIVFDNTTEVKKNIAFGNMAFIKYSKNNCEQLNSRLLGWKDKQIKIDYSKIDDDHYTHNIDLSEFTQFLGEESIEGIYNGIGTNGKKISVKYALKGWIGIHCSINNITAKENDSNFKKDKFYNPNQLRLYVRNKLAIENFLNVLNNTQTFINYIEGEINFDLLDDDNFPDIATSNRQSMDEHDDRVVRLVKIVRPIILELIKKRNDLAKKILDKQKQKIENRQKNAKSQFATEVDAEIKRSGLVEKNKLSELVNIITNKIKGDVEVKNKYSIFISHAKEDKIFTDFIYDLLIKKGVKKEEIFYTSKDNDPDSYEELTSLSSQIKESIINTNTQLLYFIGATYKRSEYCMFEGGAGWATRAIGEYILMPIEYEHVPKFLTNGKKEFKFRKKDNSIPLDIDTYSFLIRSINKLIDHINCSRNIMGTEKILKFEEVNFPDKFTMSREKKSETDYMDKEFVDRWSYYIKNKIQEYESGIRESLNGDSFK